MKPSPTAVNGIFLRSISWVFPVAAGLFLLLVHIPLLAQEQPRLSGHSKKVISLQFSPDGTMLASSSYDRTLRLWDVASHKEKFAIDDPNPYPGFRMIFAPDGKELTTISHDNGITISYWDLVKGRHRQTIRTEGKGAALSWDRELVFQVNSASTGRIIELATGKNLLTLADLPVVTGLLWAPDQSLIALQTSRDQAGRYEIQLRDTVTGKVVRTLRSPDYIGEMVFSPDGKTLAACTGLPDRISLWDVQTGKVRMQLRASSRDPIKISPDSRLLAVNKGNLVQLWDLTTGKKWLDLPPGVRPYSIQDFRLEMERQKQGIVLPPEQRPDAFNRLAFSPDGRTLAASCANNSIRLLAVPEKK